MAEKGSAVAEQAPAESQSPNGAAANDSRSYIVVPMPQFMRERFIAEAKSADKPTGPYVRDLLAEKLGIELPKTATTRRSKYASPEEAKAAQKAKAKERNELIKSLLEEHRKRLAGDGTEAQAQEAAAA